MDRIFEDCGRRCGRLVRNVCVVLAKVQLLAAKVQLL